MTILNNDLLTITVKEHGAELASVKKGNREYMWQADEAFWKRHSPVLFPIVGAVWNSEYRSHGNVYKLGQHGFARDMDFMLVSKTDDEVRYRLTSTDETKAKYPYDFVLEIGYRIIGNRVRVMWHVENNDSEELAFQIGAHPAFFWPLLSDAQTNGSVEEMLPALAATDDRGYFRLEADAQTMPISVITEQGCIGSESAVTLDDEGYLKINADTFDNDTLIFEDSHVKKVTLLTADKKPYLSLEFTSPLVGLWSPPKKRAPFVCIEPWYGRTDRVGFTGLYEEKDWIQRLAPAECFDASYDIIVEP